MDFHIAVAAALFLIGIPACALMGRERWLVVGGITTVLTALVEVFEPFGFLRNEFDEHLLTAAQVQLVRYVGCVRLANGLMLLWSRKSEDESVKRAALFSEAFAFVPINTKAIVMYLQSAEISSNPKRLVALVITLLWMWGNGFHFVKSWNKSFPPGQQSRDTNLARDFLVTAMTGVFITMFPVETVRLITSDTSKPNELVIYTVTSLGVLFIGNSFISYLAQEFLQAKDKKAQLFIRLMAGILIFTTISYHKWGQYWNVSAVGIAFQLFIFWWAANAVHGILTHSAKIKEN